jgi:hypothetical protein
MRQFPAPQLHGSGYPDVPPCPGRKAVATQPAVAAAQSTDDDWKWVIYPIYGGPL